MFYCFSSGCRDIYTYSSEWGEKQSVTHNKNCAGNQNSYYMKNSYAERLRSNVAFNTVKQLCMLYNVCMK